MSQSTSRAANQKVISERNTPATVAGHVISEERAAAATLARQIDIDESSSGERDAEGVRRLGETIVAYYDFDIERGWLDSDPQEMPELPNTGAGGIASGPPAPSRP